jgi:O-antigen/teichoic acid export membrane protein
MLGFMRQPNEVAVYDACMKTAGLTFFVFTAMSALAAPKFVELYYGGDRTALVSFVRSIARWTFWPSAAVVLGVVALGRIVLSFFGTSFVVGYPSLVLLAVGYLTFAITGPTNAYLTASGHQDDIVPAVATASILNIALNLVLIPRHGVLGASVASVISIVVARVWLYVAVRRRLGLDTLFYR